MPEVKNAKTDPDYLLQLLGAAVWYGVNQRFSIAKSSVEKHRYDVEIVEEGHGEFTRISVKAKTPRRI